MSEAKSDVTASCMDDFDPNSLSVDAAVQRIQSAIQPLTGFERLAIRSALGRTLAENIHSKIDVPGHTNSAMDGYAINGSDIPTKGLQELRLLGTSWAGRPYVGEVGKGQCVRIMTGAAMPQGTDSVVIQEKVEQMGDRIRFDAKQQRGQNVRKAGEDIARGELVLKAGKRLVPADVGLLASLGIIEVMVYRRLRVAFFSTGDELRSLGEPLEMGAIYDSNRYTLHGMLNRIGAEITDMGVIRDVREDLHNAFLQAATTADAIITSGGVSVGEADFVKEILEEVGEISFWKVAMKPGRPLAFGRVKNAVFFGLPGNPVSVMVTFYLFVQPALRKLMGDLHTDNPTIKIPCTSRLRKRPGRVEYQRGVIERDQDQTVVRKTGPQGSGILSSMSEANCFIVLPLESAGVSPGEMVEVLPFAGLV